MTSRIGVSAVLVAMTAAALFGQATPPGSFGQQPPPGPSPRPAPTAPPVFRSGVEAVQMDVFVTDMDDKPVSGLTVDDFEVFEAGTPQVITTFSPVNMPIERRERLPFDAESDVQTNQREPRHVYLILLGRLSPDGALLARTRLRQFFAEYFGENDLAAVAVVGGMNMHDGQDFTSNRRLLLEAIGKFVGFGSDEVKPKPWIVSQDLWQHMELLARIPGGRKSVLLLLGHGEESGVFSVDDVVDYRGGVPRLEQDYFHGAMAAASRANIPIYPINPSGAVDFNPNTRDLAQLTGGFAHTSGNDFAKTFDRIVTETSTYYAIGFNSTLVRKEGRHIDLEARVTRPGLKVRTRSGHVEQLAFIRAYMPPEPKRTPVETALANPLATSGLPLRVFAAPYKRWERVSTVALAVELDAASLGFAERGGRFATDFEIHHLATDAGAKIHPEYRHRGRLNLDEPTYTRARTSGIRAVSQFDLPAGRYQVRVAWAHGATKGSVVYDLVVPDFRNGPLAMSGVALTSLAAADVLTLRPDKYRRSDKGAASCRERVCQASTTFDDVLTSYANTKGGDPPLLRDVLPAPPTATREFASTDTLALFVEVYDNRGRKDKESPIVVTATLHNPESIAVGQVSDTRSSNARRRASGGHGITLRLPLEGIPAGSYVLRVEATSGPEEMHSVSRSIPIRVR